MDELLKLLRAPPDIADLLARHWLEQRKAELEALPPRNPMSEP